MTVQSENNIVRTEGDGSVVAFDYNFPIVSEDHLEVYLDGVLQGSGYTVTGVGDPNGGTVTFSVAPGDNVQVILRRFVPYTQLVDYITGDKFPADTHESGLDLAMMAASQLQEQFQRTIRYPITSSTASAELPDPDDTDNWGKAYVLDSAGAGISMHPITGGGDIEVLTTRGDLVYHAGSSVTRLPIGADYSKLISEITPKWVSQAVFYVSDLYTPDGVTDDYASIQSILDAYVDGTEAATIVFEAGKTYNLSRSLVTKGKVILDGNGATLQALSGGFTGTAAANTSSLIRNYNHGYNNIPAVVSSFLDSNIVIRNFHMTYNGEAAAGQGNICIWLRYVDRYLIQNCTFGDSGDPVGILACRRGLTDHCYAEAFINAGYDHWDGCIDCGVTNSVLVSTLADTAQGIQFTGTGSLGENRNTVGCYAMFNKVYGIRNGTSSTASAIIFNANDADSSVQNCVSAYNYIEDADLGVVFSGAGSNNISVGDVLKDVDQAPMFMQHANSDSPNYCRFLDTTLIDCDSVGSGLVTLTGAEPEVRGLKVINSGAAPYAYIVNIASTATNAAVSIQKAPDGTSGRVLNAGTTSKIYGEAISYTPALSFGGASVGITYTSTTGTFTRNGDTIHVRGTIVVNDNGSSSGGAAISLPVTGAAAPLNGLMTCWLANATGLTSAVTGAITTGATVAALYDHGATGAAVITEANIINGTTISFDAHYRVPL